MRNIKMIERQTFWPRVFGYVIVGLVVLTLALLGCQPACADAIPSAAQKHRALLVRSAHAVWGLDAPLATFAAQVHQESRWRVDARSPVGAEGLAQFMPTTTQWIASAYPKHLANPKPYNPGWAMRALVMYDKSLLKQNQATNECEQWAMALSAYNGGQGWVTGTKSLTTALNSVDSESNAATESVDELSGAAADLGKEAAGAGAGTKKLNSALEGVDTSAGDAANSLAAADDSAAQVAQKLHETGVAADQAASSVGKMGQRYDEAGNPIETARQEIAETNDELDNVSGASEKAGTSIGSLTKRLLGLAAAAVGIHTVTDIIKDMLGTGDEFERLSLQMDQTMGSLAAGKEATEWVKDFAKNTPLQLQEVTDTFLRLKNFGLDPQAGAMQAIVDQSAKLGKGYEAVEGISLALGQAWAKQKLQGNDILQLIDRGVPIWELLAKVTGKNTEELFKMSEAGELGRDTIKALIDEMGKQSAGAAAQNMSLLSGYISNLTDEWQLFLNEIAQSGALDYAKDQLRQLIQYIQELKANGQLKEYAKNISDAFVSVAEASKVVVLAIKDNIGTIALLAKAYAAVKLAGFANDARLLAVTLGTTLAGGTSVAAAATKTLVLALRAIPFLLVVDQVIKLYGAYKQLTSAKSDLAKSQAALTKVQDDEIAKIKEFNEQTGLSIQSLDDIIAMQKAGTVAVDEYTGKWRLATDTLTDAEIAQRAQTEAMAAAKAETEAFETQYKGLMGVLVESQKAGKDTADVIAEIGAAALNGGERGVESLSIALGGLALEGDKTKAKLRDGLAKFLASLSEEQYTKFGAGIEAALKRIEGGSDQTSNRLSFMKNILEADLAAAGQRAGVDVGKALTGIDDQTNTAINGFLDLVTKVNALGLEGSKADAILKPGLLKTLESLDTSQEINATRAAIEGLVKSQQITSAQAADYNAQLDQQAQKTKANTDVQKTSAEANKETAATWVLVGDSTKEATKAVQEQGSAVQWLQNTYTALREEVVALGPAAAAAFDKLQNVKPNTEFMRDEFGDLKLAIRDASDEINRLQNVSLGADFTGINRFLRDTALNAELVKRKYGEQKLALVQLQAAYADGSVSAQEFVEATRYAESSTSLLNNADLSALKNQIKSAQEQMDSFRESTLGTLNSLQSELAELQGNAERVAQLAYDARVADLTDKLAEAKKTGDKDAITNAQESLKLAQEIYAIKQQQIADDKKAQEQAKADAVIANAEAAEAAKERQAQQATQQGQTAPQQQTGSVQRVEIALPSGKTANLSGSVDDVNALLDFLNEAGMRSLQ